MRSRRVMRGLVAASAVALVSTVVLVQPASGAPSSSGHLPPLATQKVPEGVRVAGAGPTFRLHTPGGDREAPCSAVRADPAAYASPGQSEVVCAGEQRVEAVSPAELRRRVGGSDGGVSPSAVVANPQLHCAGDGVTNTWYYGREWNCYIATGFRVDTIDTRSGAVLGTTWWTINHAYGLDARSGTWTNFTAFYLEQQVGNPSNIVESTTYCLGSCSIFQGDPLGGLRPVAVSTAVSGYVNLGANPAYNTVINGLGVQWIDGWRAANGTPGYAQFTSPVKIRCDAQPNTGAAQGCAVPASTPALQLTGYNQGNVGVAFVYWFQYYNVDHWGQYPNGTPLKRLNNPTQASANRQAMCGTGAWTADPLVPNDSCDEFPFASSYNSGGMLGIPASQCSQARFTFNSTTGGWYYTAYPGYSTAQRCALGHVPLSDNSSVGGSYSAFIQNNRVLDADPFWIVIAG